MLKIYSIVHLISINNGPWNCIDDKGSVCFDEDCVPRTHECFTDLTFKEFLSYLENISMPNVIGSRKSVDIYYNGKDRITYKNFKTISYKIMYIERGASLDWIIKNLSTEDAIRYICERIPK